MSDAASPRLGRLADVLIGRRRLVLSLALLLTLAAWPVARRLSFDRSIESLYADDNPHLRDYRRSKQLFGGDEFAIVAYADPDLLVPNGFGLTEEGREKLTEFSGRLSRIPGVRAESTQNLADALRFKYASSRVLDLMEGVLLGTDRKTTAVVLRLEPDDVNGVSREETIRQIREIARERTQSDKPEVNNTLMALWESFSQWLGFGTVDEQHTFVVGEPVQVLDMFRYVEEDGRTLFRVSLGLLALVILLLFRNVRWVALPLLVVVATIIWTEALLVLSRMKLSMVSSMLNSLVTIIGIATVMHVMVHFREHRRTLDRGSALRQTIVELGPAIFWTVMTTAVGFGALLSSDITPVRSFGIMMSLGTLMVLVAAAAILPGGILLGGFAPDPGAAPAEKKLVGALAAITATVERHPRPLVLGTATFVVFAGLGFMRLEIETDFSKNFRKSSEIVQALDFVETRLGGAGSWEVNFPAPETLSDEYLDQVRRLADRLKTELADGHSSHTKVIALTDGLDLVPEIPLLLNTLPKRLNMLNSLQNEFVPALYNAERGRMRIVLRARERQSAESKEQLIGRVQAIADDWATGPLIRQIVDRQRTGVADRLERQFPGKTAAELQSLADAELRPQTTGLFVLLTFLIQSLLRDQLVSFVLAATGIGLMMTVAFRSVWIGLISLVPNLFPIVLVIGTMGWIGLPINIATAMIASVSMGLTVDSSIHYLAGYRRSRDGGAGVIEALRATHSGVGRALVFANLALIVGFSVLTLSHFIPLIYFGVLVSVAMLGGLIGNLVLLPLLLRWVEGEARSAERGTGNNETT